MATRSGPNRLKTPALRGGIMVDTTRGKLRVRAWPKKRGAPKSPALIVQNAYFKDVMRKVIYADGRAVDWAYQQSKQTGLYPRDILARCGVKGMFEIRDPERGTLQPRQLGIWTVMFQGAIFDTPPAQNLIGGLTTKLVWAVPTLDTVGLWDASAPTRITIPKGVNIINVSFSLQATGGTSFQMDTSVFQNGVSAFVGNAPRASTPNNNNMTTGPIIVAENDYLECGVFVNGTRPINPALTRCRVEILDASLPFNP